MTNPTECAANRLITTLKDKRSKAYVHVNILTCNLCLYVVQGSRWSVGIFNTLRAHDAFMRHGYKSRIFVHISTHASAIVSAVNAADAILR